MELKRSIRMPCDVGEQGTYVPYSPFCLHKWRRDYARDFKLLYKYCTMAVLIIFVLTVGFGLFWAISFIEATMICLWLGAISTRFSVLLLFAQKRIIKI